MGFMDFNFKLIEKPDETTFIHLLEQLRKKVKELNLTVTPRVDDQFLTKFLRTKDYKVEEALKYVRLYYENVQRHLDFIEGIRPSDFTDAFTKGPVLFFKHRSKGRRVGALQARYWNPKEMKVRDVQLAAVLAAENMLNEVDVQEKGCVVIFDCKGLTFEQVTYITPKEIKRSLLTATEGLPVRVSEVHIINPPALYWPVHWIAMKFVKDKIRKRIHLHYNYESLHKYIDPATCPDSLGGILNRNEAMDNDTLEDILQKNVLYEYLWNGDLQES